MTINELKALIKLENKLVGPPSDYRKLGYGFYLTEGKTDAESIKEFGLTVADHFLLESYVGATCFYVDEQLRDSVHVAPDQFTNLYAHHLNNLLDTIESLSSGECWRWHVLEDEYAYVKERVGQTMTFPDFKSTSLKYKKAVLRYKIITSKNSAGKKIYKHIHEDKAQSEQEILFKSGSQFRIEEVNDDHILLLELDKKVPKTNIECFYNFWEPEIVYSRRAHELLYGPEEAKRRII